MCFLCVTQPRFVASCGIILCHCVSPPRETSLLLYVFVCSVLRNECIHPDSYEEWWFSFSHSSVIFLSHSRGFYLLPRSCLCISIAMAASKKARNVLWTTNFAVGISRPVSQFLSIWSIRFSIWATMSHQGVAHGAHLFYHALTPLQVPCRTDAIGVTL